MENKEENVTSNMEVQVRKVWVWLIRSADLAIPWLCYCLCEKGLHKCLLQCIQMQYAIYSTSTEEPTVFSQGAS